MLLHPNTFMQETGFSGFFDTSTVAAPDHAFAFERLATSYTGDAMTVREDSGDTEADIGFNADGSYDIDAWDSHVGANNAYVAKWYDQFGSLDPIQATLANQPKVGTTGTHVVTTGSEYAMEFDGTNDFLKYAGSDLGVYVNSDSTIWVTAKSVSGNSYDFIIGVEVSGSSWFGIYTSHASFSNGPAWDRYHGGWKTASYSTSNEATRSTQGFRYDDAAGTAMRMYLEDTERGSNAGAGSVVAGTKDFLLGKAGGLYGKLQIEKILIWNSLLTTTELTEVDALK